MEALKIRERDDHPLVLGQKHNLSGGVLKSQLAHLLTETLVAIQLNFFKGDVIILQL